MITPERHSLLLTIFAAATVCCAWPTLFAAAQSTIPDRSPTVSGDAQGENPANASGVVSPTSLDFGQVLLDQTSPQRRVRLANTGDSELTVSNISITGPFELPVNHCANGVKPGTHCDVYVTVTPPSLGPQAGTLTFTDNASNSPQKVSLTGVGATTVSTSTRLMASPTSFLAGQPVALQATVTSLGGGVIPDGDQVAFSWKGGSLGNGTLQKGVATITTSAIYYVGETESLVAQYLGDVSFYPSKGTTGVRVSRYGSTVTLTSAPNPSIYREPVTVTGTVSSGSPEIGGYMFIGGLCGDIEFRVPATEFCKTVAKNVGTYQLYATYKGDGYNAGGYAFSTQVINPTNTTTGIASSKNPSNQGQTVKFSVIVRAPYAHPVIGSVTLTSGADILGTVQLVSSGGSITVSSLPVGKNTITATYNPGSDTDFLGSSASLVQVVK
jgi:hypothetical protein